MHLRFIAIFASVQRRRKERKKIKTLAARISEMAEAISFKIWNADSPSWQATL